MHNAFVDVFSRWLAATRMSLAIGEIRWITPSVQCVHILAIATTLACMPCSTCASWAWSGARSPWPRCPIATAAGCGRPCWCCS
ncbi:MAG: hypothetical protein WDN45_00365 [Caulobacteraceae bacterium]